jgi:DNA-binding response OmpR family regulator
MYDDTNAPRPTRASASPRVLVVNDDRDFTGAVRQVFSEQGYTVVECNQRDEALLGVVRGERYDLILYDLVGGPEEASDFHREVSIMSPGLAARIVFLSAAELPTSLPSARIAKPFGEGELREWVTELVGLRTKPPAAPEGEPARATVSRETIIVDALSATLRALRDAEQTRRVRDLHSQARSYEATIRRWATVPPSVEQVGAMFDLVTDLHEEAIATVAATRRPAPS